MSNTYEVESERPGSPAAELELRDVCRKAEPGDVIVVMHKAMVEEVESRLAILGKAQTLDLLAKGMSMFRARYEGVYVKRGELR